MATAPTSPSRGRSKPAGEVVEYAQYVEDQLRRTRSQVRWVDVTRGLLILATGGLIYLLLAALMDHLVPGGLGFWPRLLLCAAFLIGCLTYFILKVLPVLTRRINLVYAAHTIERSRPTLKNSLVNFLLLRGERSRIPGIVFQAIEQKAATDLSGVPVETAVDRSDVIRVGYVLMAVVAVFCVYTLVSPKSPVQSVGRVLFPWAGLAPATRVTISEIKPGHVTKFNGDYLNVSAVVQGVRTDEEVTVFFTTVDGQSVDRPVPMNLPKGTYRHQAELPPGEGGLQQTLEYYLAAGDAVSPRYKVLVISSPVIDVEGVDYDYPDYTGLENRSVAYRGDILAIEGTEVTIRAKANQPIASAYIDLGCDGKRDTQLEVNGDRAHGKFKLALNKDGKAEFDRYQLRFTNRGGEQDLHPIRHRIEVTADEPPQIAFTAPEKDDVSVPENGALNLAVRAKDPDFALREVIVSFQRDGAARDRQKLLDEVRLLDELHSGEYIGTQVLQIAKLGVKAGDTVIYWAEARDNRQPEANRARTVEHRLRITPPVSAKQQQEQLAEAQQQQQEAQQQDQQQKGQGQPGNQQQPGQQQPGADGPQAPPDAGQDAAGDKQPPGEGAEQQSQPVSQDSPGDAFDQILKHRQQQESEEGKDDSKPQDPMQQQQEQQQESGDQSKQGEKQGDQQAQAQQETGQGNQQGSAQPQAGNQGEAQQRQTGAPQAGGDKGQPDQQRGGQQKPKDAGEGGQQQPSDASQKPTPGGQGNQPQPKPAGGESQQPKDAAANQQQPKPGENQRPQDQGKQQPGGQGATKDPAASNDQATADRSATGEQQAPGGQGDPSQAKQPSAQQPGQQQAGKPMNDGQPGQQSPGEKEPMPGAGAQQQPGAGAQNQQTPQARDPNQKQPNPNAQGQGDKAQAPSGRQEQPKDPSQTPQQEKATGGEPNQAQGESGAGEPGKNNPSPSPQEASKPRDKQQGSQPGQPPQDKGESANSPGISQKESDSQGGEQGDRKGGGEEGGGQKANQPGTGGAGQNTASEQGASKSNEKGQGDTSGRAGTQAEASRPTGKSGDKQGAGTNSRQGDSQAGKGQPAPDGAGGEKSGRGAAGDTPGQGGASPPNGQQRGGAGQPPAEPGGDRESGDTRDGPGGAPGNDVRNPEPGAEPGADDPNLAFAEKATDLALEHLKDQLAKKQPDQDLLDRLGWSRADLEKFLARWEQMKQAAKAEGAEGDQARQKLKDALESLGLKPRTTAIQGREGGDDKLQNLREARRSAPPPEFAEQFRAYTEGTSKAKP